MELQNTDPRGHKGKWLDALFLVMVLVSFAGLAYTLLHQ
jgi:hypothetical protein